MTGTLERSWIGLLNSMVYRSRQPNTSGQPRRVNSQRLEILRRGTVEVVDDENHFLKGHLPDHQ